jgi:hypothetical protein
MAQAADLTRLISSLSAEEREAVAQFIQFLREQKPLTVRAALDAFVAEHQDLLRRLAE